MKAFKITVMGLAAATLTTGSLLGSAGEAATEPPRGNALRRFLEAGPPTVYRYQARRMLEATARGGGMRATMEAIATFEHGRFSYRIVSQSGSTILRSYVLERALDEERRTINEGRTGEAALTPKNYQFVPVGGEADGVVSVGMVPHAPAPMLLDGQIRLDPMGGLVAVSGRLSESPSFWTLQVDIERHYSDIAGFRVPTLMRSKALVRVAGSGTFQMRYTYIQINGHRVGDSGGEEPIAPALRSPHIIPANHVGGSTSTRKLS